jgi:hypothetical protein
MRHPPIQRLEHIKTLQDLYDELNKREFLRGRFIVFPHVGESSNFTLLRSGFAAQYKGMPCVGGFVDGSVAQHGKGNIDIVNGRNKDYGNKAIAVFQTSDNRNRNQALCFKCNTVFHCHLHLIPRRKGDVELPRGGVRHVIPGKGNLLRACNKTP